MKKNYNVMQICFMFLTKITEFDNRKILSFMNRELQFVLLFIFSEG